MDSGHLTTKYYNRLVWMLQAAAVVIGSYFFSFIIAGVLAESNPFLVFILTFQIILSFALPVGFFFVYFPVLIYTVYMDIKVVNKDPNSGWSPSPGVWVALTVTTTILGAFVYVLSRNGVIGSSSPLSSSKGDETGTRQEDGQYTKSNKKNRGPTNTKIYGGATESSSRQSTAPSSQFCPSCGTDLTEYGTVNSCPSCGADLTD